MRAAQVVLLNLVVCHFTFAISVSQSESGPVIVARHIWLVLAIWHACYDDPVSSVHFKTPNLQLNNIGLDMSNREVPQSISKLLSLIATHRSQLNGALLVVCFHSNDHMTSLCIGKSREVCDPICSICIKFIRGLALMEQLGFELEELILGDALKNKTIYVRRRDLNDQFSPDRHMAIIAQTPEATQPSPGSPA